VEAVKVLALLLRAARARHLVILHPQSTLDRPNAIAHGRVRPGGQGNLCILNAFSRGLWGASVGDRSRGIVGEGVWVEGSARAYHLEGTGHREKLNLKVRVV
jgi:hypothetical protein